MILTHRSKHALTWAANHGGRILRRFERDIFPWIGKDEIEKLLGQRSACVFCCAYGVTSEGNFEVGENILHAALPAREIGR